MVGWQRWRVGEMAELVFLVRLNLYMYIFPRITAKDLFNINCSQMYFIDHNAVKVS